MSEQADTDLLYAWRQGDRIAGGELFRRHFASVQRFFRNTVEPGAIDDLVQTTFVACVEGRDRFEQRSSFRTYLFGVAHNVVRTHYRRRRKHASEQDIGSISVVDLGLGPSTLLGHKREQRVLIEALRQIPLDSQILLQLRYWERLRTAELGEILGVPRGTAVDRLRRAQAQLEQAIARLEASPEVLESTVASLAGWAASLAREPGERDPQLAAAIPERLGRRPIVGRSHTAKLERARYHGANTELELSVRRLDPDEHDEHDEHDERRSEWSAIEVRGRTGWLRWTPEPTRRAELEIRIGWVLVTLHVQPAAGPEMALELVQELALDQLEELDSER
jgi:RNA polymerase sigma-70 factor (ECF subfamily)